MAEEDFQLRLVDSKDCTVDNGLQSADFPIPSLASLHLRDKAVVIKKSAIHMADNPEPQSVFPVVSSSCNQSQQQPYISMATRPEPSPADQGNIKGSLPSILNIIKSILPQPLSVCFSLQSVSISFP